MIGLTVRGWTLKSANLCFEGDLRGLEGVVKREMYDDVEEASGIRAISGSHDRGLPMEKILPHWPCTT